MSCRLIRLARKIDQAFTSKLRAFARLVATLIRRAWQDHLDRAANNAAYATAAVAVVGGLLGIVPARDVIAAVFAALLGLYIKGITQTVGAIQPIVDPWDMA